MVDANWFTSVERKAAAPAPAAPAAPATILSTLTMRPLPPGTKALPELSLTERLNRPSNRYWICGLDMFASLGTMELRK